MRGRSWLHRVRGAALKGNRSGDYLDVLCLWSALNVERSEFNAITGHEKAAMVLFGSDKCGATKKIRQRRIVRRDKSIRSETIVFYACSKHGILRAFSRIFISRDINVRLAGSLCF
jgi:hypothetical protein